MSSLSAQLQQLMAALPAHAGYADHSPKFIDFCRKAVPLLSDAANDFAPSQLVVLLTAATASVAQLARPRDRAWRTYFVELDADLKCDSFRYDNESFPELNEEQTELTPFMSAWTSAALKVADQFSMHWFETILRAHTQLNVVPDKRLVAKAEQNAVAHMHLQLAGDLLVLLKRFAVEEKDEDRHRVRAPSDDFMGAWYACAMGKLSEFSAAELMKIMDTHRDWMHRPSDEFWQRWLAEAVLRVRAKPSKWDVDNIFRYHVQLRVAMPEDAFLALASTLDFDNLDLFNSCMFFSELPKLRLIPSPAISEFLQQRLALVEAKAESAETYEITDLFLSLSNLPLRPSDAFIEKWQGKIVKELGVGGFEFVLVVHARFGLTLPLKFLDMQCAYLSGYLPKFLQPQAHFISCVPGDHGFEHYFGDKKPELSGLLFSLTQAGQSIECPAVAEQFFAAVEAHIEDDTSCEKYRCQCCLETLRKRLHTRQVPSADSLPST